MSIQGNEVINILNKTQTDDGKNNSNSCFIR